MCKKYPAQRSPANGAKFKLKATKVLIFVLQSELSDSAMVPIAKSVFVNALIPTDMMNNIKNAMKITPIEPTFMKIERSFLAVSNIKTGYITKPQYT